MKTMAKEQLAELLNGNEYRREMTEDQKRIAKENNLVVVFGYSDDNLEFEGVICDEISAWGGRTCAIALAGDMYADDEEENTYHKALRHQIIPLSSCLTMEYNSRLIRAEWCPDDKPALSWRITSNLPHASFTINEYGEPFCEGIVIDLDEVQS